MLPGSVPTVMIGTSGGSCGGDNFFGICGSTVPSLPTGGDDITEICNWRISAIWPLWVLGNMDSPDCFIL